jgi:hypothetical protein
MEQLVCVEITSLESCLVVLGLKLRGECMFDVWTMASLGAALKEFLSQTVSSQCG